MKEEILKSKPNKNIKPLVNADNYETTILLLVNY